MYIIFLEKGAEQTASEPNKKSFCFPLTES